MSYSILRVGKIKGSVNTTGLQKHNQRENNNYNNKDIDHEKTYKNYDLINDKNIDYKQMIDEKIEVNYAGKRKIRSDAIRHVDGIITSDEEYFGDMEDYEIKEFFKDGLEFLEKEYGKENMLYATVHLDERVPHMHFGFVPLTDDGRLSAKERLGNKKALTELQDRFNVHMNGRGHDMERGTSKQVTEREHRQMDQYKKDTAFHQQELEDVKSELQKAKTDLQDEIEYIRSRGSFDYEEERKGLFGGREETGRKIVSADEFERLQKTVASAERIVDDYEKLKGTDLYKRNQDLELRNKTLRDNSLQLSEGNQRLKVRNKNLNVQLEEETERRKSAEDFSSNHNEIAKGLYKNLRKNINGFEKMYDAVRERFLQNDLTETSGRFMGVIQDLVHFEDEKARNASRKRQREDLEL